MKKYYKLIGANVLASDSVIVVDLARVSEILGADFDRSRLDSLKGVLSGSLTAPLAALPTDADQPRETTPIAGLAQLFEQVAIALQNAVGAALEPVRVRGDGTPEHCAVIPFLHEPVGIEAVEWTLDFFERALGETPPEAETLFEAFLVRAIRRAPPVQDRALVAKARERDIPCLPLAGRMIVLGQGRRQVRLSATKTSLTSVVGNDIAANKDYCRRVFADLGLPAPKYARVRRRRDAIEAAKAIGYPVVVKPNNGSMGQGVTVDVRRRSELVEAYGRARAIGGSVLIEELVKGFDYRLLVIDGKFYAASQRVPGHVVGDGERSIEALLAEVNSDPRRGSGPTNSWTVIELDDQAKRLIAQHGYTPESVPKEGEVIYLRRNANTSDGGTAVDVTDIVHPDNRDIAERAARAVGLDIAGVDFLTSDIATSMWENGGKICEINSRPGIRKHLWPAEGTPRDVLSPILDMLFPGGGDGRIPVIGLVRSPEADATAERLAEGFAKRGLHVALASGRRVTSGGRPAGSDELTPPEAARRVLLDPCAEIAILALDAEDIVAHGVGLDGVDIAIVPSVSATRRASEPDHAQVAEAVEVMARCARRAVIVGAANPVVERLLEADFGAPQWHLALDAPEPGGAAARSVAGLSLVKTGDGPSAHPPLLVTAEAGEPRAPAEASQTDQEAASSDASLDDAVADLIDKQTEDVIVALRRGRGAPIGEAVENAGPADPQPALEEKLAGS